MIEFILGRAGSGKSEEIRRRAAEAQRLGLPVLVVVPEQYTFETERGYYEQFGARAMQGVQVISFSRLVHQVFKQYGGAAGDYADDSIRLIMMNLALAQVQDSLQVYEKASAHTHFTRSMVEMVAECKHAGVDAQQMEQTAQQAGEGLLGKKASDIASVYTVYDALLGEHYKDALDDMARAGEKIRRHGYFRGNHIFIDEFKSFTAPELQLIALMAGQAEGMTFSLCTDHRLGGENSLFAPTNETYARLKRVCREAGAGIAAPVVLDRPQRFRGRALAHLEENILRPVPQSFDAPQEEVRAVTAANEYEEADYAAATIRALVESGQYRYRDFVLVSRALDGYLSPLENAFSKYGIPYYLDMRRSISFTPLIRMIGLCFDCILHGYRTEDMLALLKCGLCGCRTEEIAGLENYLYLWDIRGRQWKQPFSLSIYGTDHPTDEEAAAEGEAVLAGYNALRTRLVGALEQFRKQVSGVQCKKICSALVQLLERLGVLEQLNGIIGRLSCDPSDAAALEHGRQYRRVWEITGEILQVMTTAAGEVQMAPARFRDLFSLLAEEFDLGTIPQTLDCVTVGSAERIRTDTPKVLFVLGVNDKVFPYVPESGGLLSDKERRALLELGVELSKPLKERIREERFIAYQSLCLASERLYLTARKTDISGKEQALSVLFSQIGRMFGQEALVDTGELDPLYFGRTRQTAFSVLAARFREDNTVTASLREFFSTDQAYAGYLEQIYRGLHRNKWRLEDLKQAKALYGRQMTMSPTRVEQFYQCRFAYFCRHGLRIVPRRKITLTASSRGTVIHDILYRVCSSLDDFSAFDGEKVRALIREVFDSYLADTFGGGEARTKRFLYLYRRIERTVFLIVRQLFDELSQSRFRPAEFEYQIGAPGNARPLAVTTAEGTRVYLSGTIDRVDRYQTASGQEYLRVIDYKSGVKTFRLSDVMNGVNLQMLIYLMCLEQDGEGLYRDAKGAGVLYMPARDPHTGLPRDAGEQDTQGQAADSFRMKGLVLDDEEVIRAMEEQLQGRYVPVTLKAEKTRGKADLFVEKRANPKAFTSGSLDHLLTAQQLGKLFSRVERAVRAMAQELHQGAIEAKPLKEQSASGTDACRYCDYAQICGFDGDCEINPYQTYKNKQQVMEALEQEE